MEYKTIEDNTKYFNIYKSLPLIFAIVTITLFFVWGIIDATLFKNQKYILETSFWGTRSDFTYGIMNLESAFECLLVWTIIGCIPATAVYFVVKIKNSAVILQTEYLAMIANVMCGETETSQPSENPWNFNE